MTGDVKRFMIDAALVMGAQRTIRGCVNPAKAKRSRRGWAAS